jgi:hypothetical protein
VPAALCGGENEELQVARSKDGGWVYTEHDPAAIPVFGGFSVESPVRNRPVFFGKPGSGTRHTSILCLAFAAILGVCSGTAELKAASYEVGPGLIYPTIASVPALGPGDVVNIHCGTYREVHRWTTSGTAGQPITLRGVCSESRPVIDAAGLDTSGNGAAPRGAWQVDGNYYVIANLEFKNAHNGDNGAGFRTWGHYIEIDNCKMDYNDMGIMTSLSDDSAADNILVQNSEIAYNGTGYLDGLSHNVYSAGNSITFQYCYIHDAVSGENFKSRAHYTQLLYNFIGYAAESEVEGDDDPPYTITPNSNMVLIGNTLVSTPNRTVNDVKFILFGQDTGGGHTGTLYLINNTLIAGSGTIGFLRSNLPSSSIVAVNNIFYGSNNIVQPGFTANTTGNNNWVPATASIPPGFTGNTAGTDPAFVNLAGTDFHLTSGSTARKIGATAPVYLDGSGVSYSAIPAYEYVKDLSETARIPNTWLDAGAYEFPGTVPTVLTYKVLFGTQSYNLLTSTRVRLPWQITGIQVTFSEPITSGDIHSLTGVTPTGFSGLGTSTLTWNISPLSLGNFTVALSGSGAHAVMDSSGNLLMGGAGFTVPLKVLWGDFNDDGKVNASDLTLVNNARAAAYNIFADLNGDGVVDLNDVQIVRTRNGTVLP